MNSPTSVLLRVSGRDRSCVTDDEIHPVTIFLFVHFTGYARMQSNIKNGERQSTATAYLRPVINRPNLHISLNTMATKVLLFIEQAQFYTYVSIK
jgi:choline dehydrogenase-like flavoprotein